MVRWCLLRHSLTEDAFGKFKFLWSLVHTLAVVSSCANAAVLQGKGKDFDPRLLIVMRLSPTELQP